MVTVLFNTDILIDYFNAVPEARGCGFLGRDPAHPTPAEPPRQGS
jgi:hypothetical protein